MEPVARTRTRRDRRRRGVLWTVLLAAVLILETTLLHGRLAADLDRLAAAGRGVVTPTGGIVVPRPPEPPAQGAVAGSDLRTMGVCAPGARCTVRVRIHLSPRPAATTLRWGVRVQDLCGGGSVTVPAGDVDVAPGSRRVDPVVAVPMPAGQAVALTPVTGAPDVTAGEPVLVPPGSSCGTAR